MTRAGRRLRGMRRLTALLALVVLLTPAPARPALSGPLAHVAADIVFLGEVHDNPGHHAVQAEAVADLAPAAVVFEMLTPEQAGAVTPDNRGDAAALAAALDWAATGWPDFDLYYPIFAAAPEAVVIGAGVPREGTREAMQIGVPRAFGEGADIYGLTDELGAEELADRLNLQLAAHCGAMPTGVLPAMVDLQRLRDAMLARAALDAFETTGGPVIVITGNGHARKDWGAPSYLARVAPDVPLFSLGQGEDGGVPDGGFDMVLDAPGVDRDDPCAVFDTRE